MRRVAVLLLLVLLGAGAAAAGARFVFDRPGPMETARDVVVPRATTAGVADALRRAGAIGSSPAFRLAVLVTRGQGPIRAAEFRLPAHASLRTVLRVLRTAHPVEHALTVPEGLTAATISELVLSGAALTGPVTVPREGAVLPQTYDYERGTTRDQLLGRMTAAMTAALARTWRDRAPEPALATPGQLLVLASLVERETAVAAERPTVAAVFLNRLRLGMKLQSDPTAAYVAAGGLGALARPLTRADLALDGPTNTYLVAGLPASPICSPGLASLRAAAHPAETDALYFVADGLGGHVFSADLAEHLRHVARWRALSRQPGASRDSVLRTTPLDTAKGGAVGSP